MLVSHPPRRFGLSSRRCDPDAAPLPLAAHRVRVHEYSSPARFVEQAVLFDFHMEPLEIWDLRDPGRPQWAGGDQPPDRFLTGQDVVVCCSPLHSLVWSSLVQFQHSVKSILSSSQMHLFSSRTGQAGASLQQYMR